MKQMNLFRILLFAGLTLLTSCNNLLVNYYFKTPRVENNETLRSFLSKGKFNTDNQYYLVYDTLQPLQEQLFKGISEGYYVFDEAGDLVCYEGSERCSGKQFAALLEKEQQVFKSCKNDSLTLHNLLKDVRDLNNGRYDMGQLPKTRYVIVQYWAKFLGGRLGYRDVEWMEQQVAENNGANHFTFIKVNTDFNEASGFAHGKKAKLKVGYDKEGGFAKLLKAPALSRKNSPEKLRL